MNAYRLKRLMLYSHDGGYKMMATVLIFMALTFTSYTAAFGQELSAEQRIRDFLSEVLGITATNISESPSILYESFGLPYKIFIADGCCKISASVDGSIIYRYMSDSLFADEEDTIKGKTLEDAISDDEAFSAAVPILEFYELPTEKSEYQMDLIDPFSEIRGDLFGSEWFIEKEIKLNGIPCRTRAIYIGISAASKKIVDFEYYPIIPPENTLDNAITYASAQRKAWRWILVHFLTWPALTGDANAGIQVIAPNLNRLKSVYDETEPTKTFYCWEVPFTWKQWESTLNGVVWVNLQTGEIVGSDQVYE
jgi:hypothetical protein